MTTSVKERIKTELGQAQVEGKQRAVRIGDILKDAASLTFEELKEGSSELHVATRKTLAEILEELKVEDPETVEAIDEVAAIAIAEEVAKTQSPAPTWKSILRSAFEIVRNRRGDWFQSFKEYWNQNVTKVDQDLTDEYGDRYAKAKSFLQRVIEQVRAHQAAAQSVNKSDAEVVSVEVIDNSAESSHNSSTAEGLESKEN